MAPARSSRQRIADADVSAAFAAVPRPARDRLLALRALILDIGAEHGAVEESLKWGEPAYRVHGGSTVRLGWKAAAPDQVAMYFICTTKLVARFRAHYPESFVFSGDRALVFPLSGRLPLAPLRHCIAMAFTYHRVAGRPR
ncbi:MAG: DUF1801 domain-containing protein [Alphaproteobacteria bacterium]|nr:DUF1801 domain-containing protein [Alphaproteobacteria bacterium]